MKKVFIVISISIALIGIVFFLSGIGQTPCPDNNCTRAYVLDQTDR